MEVSIRQLNVDALDAAAELAARSLGDSPLYRAALGPATGRRHRKLRRSIRISLGLKVEKGIILGAYAGPVLVGVAAWAEWPACQVGFWESIALAPRMLASVGFAGCWRMSRWAGRWDAYHPHEPHWHLGPLVVDPSAQRRGVGRSLLAEFCRRLDAAGVPAYLEIDRLETAAFYEKFGFQTAAETTVLGVPNWFMQRLNAGS